MEQLISSALEAAAFSHHQEFHDLNHTDPNWSDWYAQWLLEESEISDLLSPHFGIEQLSAFLHKLDGRYQHSYQEHAWCDLYAQQIARLIDTQ